MIHPSGNLINETDIDHKLWYEKLEYHPFGIKIMLMTKFEPKINFIIPVNEKVK
jgi:hypothetical protein